MSRSEPDLDELIRALTRPEAYPRRPDAPIRVLHTHISVLFFAGDRVYKVKRPVTLDFLDYSTAERREHYCHEELRLNRRLAPETYLRVAPINRDADGVIAVDGAGPTVEHAVEMVHLPEDRMMSALLERGCVGEDQIDRIAALLAEFHADCPTGPGVDEYGRVGEIRDQVGENLRELRSFVTDAERPGGLLSAHLLDHLERSVAALLDDHAALLERRVDEGRVREGHGDLHAGNICLLPEGIVIYDCVEFAARFRCRDVACELAFLAMDLDARGSRALSRRLIERYARVTGDRELAELVPLFKLHLALVRGKVTALMAGDPQTGPDTRAEAMRYLHLAAGYTLPPALILTCGLPGTGKSWTARAIARPLGAEVLRSDVVRKELAGPADGEGLYSPQATRETYATLRRRARDALMHGRPVVVDATFRSAALRAPFVDLGHETGAEALVVEVTCDEQTVRRRLAERGRDPAEVSDADWRVYLSARERFERPEEIDPRARMAVDGRLPPEAIAAAVLERLLPAG